MALYKTNKQTNVLRWTPGQTNILGETASTIVRTLSAGEIFEVSSTGSGGNGTIATPYLILPNGDFVIGWDASPYSGSSSTSSSNNSEIPTPVKVGAAILFGIGLVVFLPKLFK